MISITYDVKGFIKEGDFYRKIEQFVLSEKLN